MGLVGSGVTLRGDSHPTDNPSMRRYVFAITLLALAVLPAHALTSYSRMTVELERDAARSSRISLASLGKSASGARSVWLVRVSQPGIDDNTRLRIQLILCRQHGDEPASTEAALGFLKAVTSGKDPTIARALKHLTVYIVPMVNPDGADALTRLSGAGVDLNRDWLHFDAPETRSVMRAVRAVRPQVAIDMHSWDMGDTFRSTCIEMPREGDIAKSASAAARLSDVIGNGIVTAMRDASVSVDATSYGSDADDTLCHRYFPLSAHIPAILFETRPGPNTEPDLAKRTAIARTFITSALSDLASDPSLRARLAELAMPMKGMRSPTLFAPSPTAPVAVKVQVPVPWLARVPRAIWYALVLYALGATVIGLFKPKPVTLGTVRLTSVGTARDRRVRAVYLPSDQPVSRSPLTRNQPPG